MTTRRNVFVEDIHSVGFQDIREGVTLQSLVTFQRLGRFDIPNYKKFDKFAPSTSTGVSYNEILGPCVKYWIVLPQIIFSMHNIFKIICDYSQNGLQIHILGISNVMTGHRDVNGRQRGACVALNSGQQ